MKRDQRRTEAAHATPEIGGFTLFIAGNKQFYRGFVGMNNFAFATAVHPDACSEF